jgi:hypothetical protein
MAHHASVKPDARRHAFAGAGASVLASSPPSGFAGGSSHQPSPMSSSRSNPTSRTQPPHPAFGGKAGASTPPLPRSKSLAQQSLRADDDGARRNLRFVLTSADLVTIEELGENQFVLAITRPELPLPRGSPQLKRQQTIEQTMHQLVGGGAPALPQPNTSLGSKPAPVAAQRMLSSPLFGNKSGAGSPSASSSTASTSKVHVPPRPVVEPKADAQQLRDASRAVENERLRRRAEYAEKQKEFRAAAAPPPPKPKPFAAAASRSPAGAGAGAISKAGKAASASPPAPAQASSPPPVQPPPPPRHAWQRFVDEASGMPYWHHEASGLSTWTDPTAPVMPIAVAAPVRDECAIS